MNIRRKIVVFSGSGISADSGIKTFRDYDGLWENHRIEDVATPEAFKRDPALVLDFYNMRRRQLQHVVPNAGHFACAELQVIADVVVVTQNVDDLHERAGSTYILHLHGELNKAQNTVHPFEVIDISGQDIVVGDKGQNNGQLRPYIVWFGEEVRFMDEAVELIQQADFLIIVGTSLQVWPAAGLVNAAGLNCEVFVVDPAAPHVKHSGNLTIIRESATTGLQAVVAFIKAALA